MTGLEEKFYKVMGIEPKEYKGCGWDGYCPYHSQNCDTDCAYWETYKTDYPPITDHILLELVCILVKYFEEESYNDFTLFSYNKNELKNEILDKCIFWKEHIKNDVHKLFKDK